ncbi:unnamed protein product, partial [Meganyctiphanes norvegica]
MGTALGIVYTTNDNYLIQVKDVLGTPEAPQLIGGSVSGSSVGLRWSASGEVSGVEYLLQYHSQGESLSDWHYYHPDQPVNDTEIIVQDLTPYTKYQFRVAWLVLPHHEPIMSEASSWISTLASGPPRSPPKGVKAVPLDGSRVEVTWETPQFPGGDLISYTLYLRAVTALQPQLREDINAQENMRYVLSSLAANTSYHLNLTATNHHGEGPPASLTVTTYPASQVVIDGLGYLLLTSGPNVLRLGLDSLDTPIVVFTTPDKQELTGMAVHIHLDLIYLSVSSGSILLIQPSINRHGTLLTPNHLNGKPLSLSVDWLYSYLYYVVRLDTPPQYWQIWRCDLNGKNQKIVKGDFQYEPKNLHADPYNGYIWWISEDKDMDGGLHNMEINYKEDKSPEVNVILKSPNLGGLVLDPQNFQILVADRANNTMLAVTLDGTSVSNMRANIQQAFFQELQSVVHLNSRFFWTDGKEVYLEELNNGKYYHNSYSFIDGGSRLGVLVGGHSSVQPVPVPLNPPKLLQAVFTRTSAQLTWIVPDLPALMGNGAWQKWMYEVHILEGRKMTSKNNITDTLYLASNLRPQTFYIIKVRAYSIGGEGPWSDEFLGSTLDDTDEAPRLLLANKNSLQMSDLAGNENDILMGQDLFQKNIRGGIISDLAFFRDILVMAVKNQSVFILDMKTKELKQLPNSQGVLSVDVDWVTERLFWANPHKQMIGWSHLDGSSGSPLSLVSSARELRVDALRGRLYWTTTTHSLLTATLAGRSVSVMHQEGIFSGKQVFGLTLDPVTGRLWWIVRDALGWHLFCSEGLESRDEHYLPILLPDTATPGPTSFLSERLLWLNEAGNVIVSDTNLNNSATLKTANLQVTSFLVVLNELHPVPEMKNINVIPDKVNNETIMVKGLWENFTINWDPVTNINYGNLSYEIIVDDGTSRVVSISNNTQLEYHESLPPFSPLKVTVTGITEWALGNRATVTIMTPPHIPGPPTNLRTYVEKLDISTTKVHLRWSPPENPNGAIEKYEILSCMDGEIDIQLQCKTMYMKGTQHELVIKTINSENSYRFKVAAITSIGKGPYSSEVSEDSLQHIPTPSLLVSSNEGIFILDADRLKEILLPLQKTNYAKWNTALLRNGSAIWMDSNSAIYMTNLFFNTTHRILRLSGDGLGLVLDWIGERIIWAERESQGKSEIKIKSFDLNHNHQKNLTTIRISNPIKKFIASPSLRQGIWLQESYNVLKLKTSNLLVRNDFPQDFFGQNNVGSECDCPRNQLLSDGLVVDSTNGNETFLYYGLGEVQLNSKVNPMAVMKTDLQGCSCTQLFNPQDYGYGPCIELAVDSAHLFCYVKVNSTLLWMPKNGPLSSDDLHVKTGLSNITSLLALDVLTQPLPDPECLTPSNYSEIPKLIGNTEVTIALELKPPTDKNREECWSWLMPSVEYVVFYGPVSNLHESSCSNDVESCQVQRSMSNIVKVDGLIPFTQYVFYVAAETIYNKKLNISSSPGPPVVFKTKAKAPDSVRSVTAYAMSPEEIRVSFKPSKVGLSYQVHYIESKSRDRSWNLPTKDQNSTTDIVITDISKLQPNTLYEVWVRVHSEDHELHTDSPHVKVSTLAELPPLQLIQTTHTQLYVAWTSPTNGAVLRHTVGYIKDDQMLWKNEALENTESGHTYMFNITNLTPASSYLFRLRVIYNITHNQTYHQYTWPSKPIFNFTTLGYVPSPPGKVLVRQIGGSDSGGWQVWWGKSKHNGAPILTYTLQASPVKSKDSLSNLSFTTVYNGSTNQWPIVGLAASSYMFRVQAINDYGAGNWSVSNKIESVNGPTLLTHTGLPTILGATIPTSLAFFGIVFIGLLYAMRRAEERRHKVKGVSHNNTTATHHQTHREVALRTLRELPNNNNFVTENNILYNLHSFPGEELDLPHVPRQCITLTKFLGCGAFGEVFEGTACELPGMTGCAKVAIKTLRKGAAETERVEFLKEAQLMSHFQHDHILRLLAVCTDPFFLILELMEGGDLLSYLRSNRKSENGLTLSDLVRMCVDVANGCVYLEEMHFVHRDLAARNCLVTSHDPQTRIVKIGDFGLARDIYKNDYYRKEGEGLLPVRWMSPESLVDGVFTSHSDVWAFGVLLWEILTLGQQPYPARTNLEVLHYVRSGGRLNRPPNCPEELNCLMERCWSYSPDNRPTFKECLLILMQLQETISSLPAMAVHNVNYVSSNGPYGLDNLAYAVDSRDGFKDINHNIRPGNRPMLKSDSCPQIWNLSISVSGVRINPSGRGGAGGETNNALDVDDPCDSVSGTSTLPLTAPLRRQQQYLQLVNEPAPNSPVSLTCPQTSFIPDGEITSDWVREVIGSITSRQTSNNSTLDNHATASTPSSSTSSSSSSSTLASYLNPSIPESPTSVTFTFPLPNLNNGQLVDHYLRPTRPVRVSKCASNIGKSEKSQETETTVQDQVNTDDNNIHFDNSYVNMSQGAESKLLEQLSSPEETTDTVNVVNFRSSNASKLGSNLSLDGHRLSGVSALSDVSGMTSASTIDLDFTPSQSWC